MKKYIFVFISLINFSVLLAQFSLSGTVKDAQTKMPLAGVNIYIPQLQKGTVTDFSGSFSFKNIPLKDITLQLSYTGYKPVDKKIIFKTTHQHVNILMKEAVFEMDEVIISTGTNKLQKDNVMKVAHKSTQAMRRKGIQNIMEGIAQIPGVSNLSTGTGIAKPVIRGLSGNRVLVYNQGVRLENYQFGNKHGLGIDASGIAGVEVIKGPASLLYGSDALGGVVYLIPEKYAPKNQNIFQYVSQYFSNTYGLHNSIGAKTSGKHWKYLIRGSYKLNGDYQVPSGLRVINSANQADDFKAGIGYQKKSYTGDFRYNYNHTQNGIPLKTAFEPVNYNFTGKYQDLTTHNLSFKNNYKWNSSHFKTNLGLSRVRRQLVKQAKAFIDMQLHTLNADIKWYAPKYKDWEIVAGTQGLLQKNENFGIHLLLPDAHVANIGFYTNLNGTLGTSLIQVGIRYDYHYIKTENVDQNRPGFSKKLSSFSGALGIKQSLADDMNLRLNIASGFRAPNLAELTSYGEHEGRIEIGNPNLKNEQNMQIDINWDYRNTHIEFYVNGFYNRINHYIYLAPQPMPDNQLLPVYHYKQNNAYLYGGEAGLHFHPHPWDWLHVKSSFETVIGKQYRGNYLPLIPADQWKNEIRLANKHTHSALKKYYWALEINKTFKARTPEAQEEYPAYTLLNTNIGADFNYKKMTAHIFVAIHNLTNKTYISNLSVLREKNIPNQGRNIILGLDLIF